MFRGQRFILKDLVDATDGQGDWFSEHSNRALAGRCLLDVLEYLRAHPKFPGEFRQLVNSHVIRLLAICLPEITDVGKDQGYDRITAQLIRSCKDLLASRRRAVPRYGDDFWDWAQMLECFIEVNRLLPSGPISDLKLTQELTTFEEEIEQHLSRGLRLKQNDEWYGPAMAVAALKVLERWRATPHVVKPGLIKKLESLAQEPISSRNQYRLHRIPPQYVAWHLGQVVAAFPEQSKPRWRSMLRRKTDIDALTSPAQRLYALARFIQGPLR
jgi:hypothetical protein